MNKNIVVNVVGASVIVGCVCVTHCRKCQDVFSTIYESTCKPEIEKVKSISDKFDSGKTYYQALRIIDYYAEKGRNSCSIGSVEKYSTNLCKFCSILYNHRTNKNELYAIVNSAMDDIAHDKEKKKMCLNIAVRLAEAYLKNA